MNIKDHHPNIITKLYKNTPPSDNRSMFLLLLINKINITPKNKL